MNAWRDLDAELDRWRDAGRIATFWWRDDDAVAATPALARLCALRRAAGVPLGLAVIPARADQTLVAALAAEDGVTAMPHGLAHRNHAPGTARKSEFGPTRDPAAAEADVATGLSRLSALFAGRIAAVFVPPWNRIAPALVARLPSLGLIGLSTLAPRPARAPVPGLTQVNVHVDPIAWATGPRFRGVEAAVADVIRHLAARRDGTADADEPTGILTHHLVHDSGLWDFVERLIARTRAHGATRWLSVPEAFGAAAA